MMENNMHGGEPLEIERKFLIHYPDLELLEHICTKKVSIVQTYLLSENRTSRRIRKWESGGNTIYWYNEKERISDRTRIEREREITEKEYLELIREAIPDARSINKTRYCIPSGDLCFEVDIFPEWNDRAFVEVELKEEHQGFIIPECLSVIKEVTEDRRYTNMSLAVNGFVFDRIKTDPLIPDPETLIAQMPVVADIAAQKEVAWENPQVCPFAEEKERLPLSESDLDDAEARLERFAPFIEKCFPETASLHGIIESPLAEIPGMKRLLNEKYHAGISGRLLLKMDSHLPVSGSVKARGGIYEVLKHSEDLAREQGFLQDDYTVFDTPESREFFSRYAIHVGSTGNLGLSIGIMGAAVGYRVTVHMSADARQWKKDLLRSRGVTVMEYQSDYSRAVQEGRKLAEQDPASYFVDDENSETLFLGYAVAARRLKKQLQEKDIAVDEKHPLLVCIPCGVGGAPGGITFGLKQEFGDNVFCIFAEPVQAPCMLLGMATGLHNRISVQDVGLSGQTAADGLAVGRPSGFVGKTVGKLVSGIVTVKDDRLFDFMRGLWNEEGIFIEPSACAAFQGFVKLREMQHFLKGAGLTEERLHSGTYIVWATGGNMVPEEERRTLCVGS